MIHLKKINIAYDKVLLENADLVLFNGQITGIVGESGCGKTTLLQKVGLLLKCDDIDYQFHDVNLTMLDNASQNDFIRNHISFVLQDIYMFNDLTIQDVLNIHAGMVNKKLTLDDIHYYLDYVQLSLDINTPTQTMSGGEKQRLAILCGIVKNADLFIFDEPTAYLDQKNKELVMTIIKKLAYQENKAVLIATHDHSLMKECDRIYEMKEQQLFLTRESPIDEKKNELVETAFQFDILKKLTNIQNKQHVLKRIFIIFIFSIMLIFFSVFGRYNENYKEVNGHSLLSLMKNEVQIISSNQKDIRPRQQEEIRTNLINYQVFPDYYCFGYIEGIGEVVLRTYLPNEVDSLNVYKDLSRNSYLSDQKIEPIYISYDLDRILSTQNDCVFKDYDNHELPFIYSYVIKPSKDMNMTIYTPYQSLQKYLDKKGKNIELENVKSMKVVIEELSDITKVEKVLGEQYLIEYPSGIENQITIASFSDNLMFLGTVIVLFIMFVIFKIIEIINQGKEFALLKLLGVKSCYIIKMQVYNELSLLLITEIISVILSLLLLNLLSLMTMKIFIKTLLVCVIIGLSVFLLLMIISYIYISCNTAARLLKK